MGISKQERQNIILNLISGAEIETQDELNDRLIQSGVHVTQATISRDIRELKLVKKVSPTDEGRLIYAVFAPAGNASIADKSRRFLKDGIVTIKCAANIVVIKTIAGLAMGVAASIDALDDPEVIGTIAGDDTIFCVMMSGKRAEMFIKKLNSIIKDPL